MQNETVLLKMSGEKIGAGDAGRPDKGYNLKQSSFSTGKKLEIPSLSESII